MGLGEKKIFVLFFTLPEDYEKNSIKLRNVNRFYLIG